MFSENKSFKSFLAGIVFAVFIYILNPIHFETKANTVLAIACLMVFLWISEALPMATTAMLPIILFPLFNILPIKDTAKSYGDPIIFLFMGGFFLGLAIEKWNLHKRIALNIIHKTGTNGNKIILGFILATGSLSMWLSNTATTMMLFPIAMSVIHVMQENNKNGNIKNFSITLMLAIAYASNLGGIATIIGTPPNVAYVGFIKEHLAIEIPFVKWMLLCMPLSIVLLMTLYFVMVKIMYLNKIKSDIKTENYIYEEVKKLGKISVPEKRVLLIFILTALLWIFQSLINKLIPIKLDDTIVAMICAILLFVIPSGNENQEILKWKDTHAMPWGILILFGGGLALAKGLETVGIIQLLGNSVAEIAPQNIFLLILLVTTISVFISELLSNVAQVIIFAPVVTSIAISMHVHPLLLGIPMTLGASCAGMLPMGTPPNAIAFSSGKIELKDMLKTGFVMNIISILLITIFCYFILPLLGLVK